jgi:biopolymer transport protein ExbD
MTPIPSPRSKKRARIEIIPLIDIIFFLLATFVMVSLSMVKNLGLAVQLPAAATGAPQPREDAAVITIDAAGALSFNKQPVSEPELETALTQLQAGNPEAKVFINGDKKAEFGIAIAVLDQVRKLGITKVAIETQPQPPKP